ncbi:serine/threonine protein kinase [Streptomyces griseocarneus]|nr:serine/threonine protein kinase [Streptomyces griseocarneus]
MDDYAGRVLADRYRLPLPPSDVFELVETRAFDTYSGQEVFVRQIPLPEVVDAEVVGGGVGSGAGADPGTDAGPGAGGAGRQPGGTAVARALAAATAAAQIPDHPRLDQVFHVFTEAGSLWIISELVSARPLAALLAERTLSPHRAAEVAADVLAALRALHTQGWTHRNITTRTVLICDDGRAILTGLAAGAAEEALCGYDPVPTARSHPGQPASGGIPGTRPGAADASVAGTPGAPGVSGAAGAAGAAGPHGPRRTPRSGAVAAYSAGSRAAAARAAAGNAAHNAPGTSPWGGGSAASGTAPAPAPAPKPPAGAQGVAGARGGTAALPAPRTAASGPRNTPSSPSTSGVGATEGKATGWGAEARAGGALAAERARQARMVVVGPVTERWSPEQAWPVQESWQLAPPVGPAADLWALGALLFRVVQGHAPYPEDSTADLVQLVCVEPPAYAEECGALRPVVESLMRKDPAERPEFEELRGWLRSLIRSAPEPDLGSRTVTVPSIGPAAPAEQHRLPVVRRKGELVRRKRGRTAAGTAAEQPPAHGRHKRPARSQPQPQAGAHSTGYLVQQYVRAPRSLGRLLLGLILLLLIGAVLYAMLLMPSADESAGQSPAGRTNTTGARSPARDAGTPADNDTSGKSASSAPVDGATAEGDGLAKGFALRRDPKGFSVAVATDWQRRGENDKGQVVYAGDDCQLIVVPGRDKVTDFGSDPMAYQQDKESELDAYRTSSWSGASGLRRVDVGGTASAEGAFNWNDSSGRQVYVRNSAVILNGRYHVLQVIGPMNEQRAVDGIFQQASTSYRTW